MSEQINLEDFMVGEDKFQKPTMVEIIEMILDEYETLPKRGRSIKMMPLFRSHKKEIEELESAKKLVANSGNGKISNPFTLKDILIAEKNGFDNAFLKCPHCPKYFGDLYSHIKQCHKGQEIPDPCRSNIVKANLAEKCAKFGELNPAYQHGGRLSPFSRKFKKYDGLSEEEKHEKVLETASKAWSKTSKTESTFATTKKQWWIDKYRAEEGERLYSERQTTFSKEKCIEKYGPVEGPLVWQERQDRWQETLNGKSIEEKALINSKKVSSGYTVSKAEKEILCLLSQEIRGVTKGPSLPYNNGKNYFVYDIGYKNKIIEYNGDLWHANPDIYDESFINPYSKKTFTEIWEKEHLKEKIAKDNGYTLFRVWESDYKKDKEKVIKECLEFLNG